MRDIELAVVFISMFLNTVNIDEIFFASIVSRSIACQQSNHSARTIVTPLCAWRGIGWSRCGTPVMVGALELQTALTVYYPIKIFERDAQQEPRRGG